MRNLRRRSARASRRSGGRSTTARCSSTRRRVHEHPTTSQYRRSLERARLRAVEEHAGAARRLAARGLYKEALDEYRLALDLNPGSPSLDSEMQADRGAARRPARPPSLRRDEGAGAGTVPARPRAGAGAREPLGLAFRGASLREAYQALGKAAGVNFVFDPQFQDTDRSPSTCADVPFEQALCARSPATGRTFHRVVGRPGRHGRPRHARPSAASTSSRWSRRSSSRTPTSRRRSTCCASCSGARRVAPMPGATRSPSTTRPTRWRPPSASSTSWTSGARRWWWRSRSSRSTARASRSTASRSPPASPGVDGVVGRHLPRPDEDVHASTTTRTPRTTSSSARCRASSTGCCKTDGSTRLLANPQLRTTEGQTAQARFGDQVPVPVTIFTPIAQGGVAAAADHLVRVQERRRQHRHHAARAPRRRRHAGPQARDLVAGRAGLPGPAHVQQPQRQQRASACGTARPTSWPASSSDEERTQPDRHPRPLRAARPRPPVRAQPQGSDRDRHRDDADAARGAPPDLTEEDLRSFSVGARARRSCSRCRACRRIVPAPARPVEPPRIEPIRPPTPTPTPAPDNR